MPENVFHRDMMRLFCLYCRMFPMRLAGVEEFLASQVLRTLFFFLTEKDYPPVARAGNDVVIVLPVDHVVLYGNGSTDDKVQKGPILVGFAVRRSTFFFVSKSLLALITSCFAMIGRANVVSSVNR